MYNVQWSPGVTLEQVERQVIETAYQFYKQNKSQTARALDIAVRTLETKLEKYVSDDSRDNANLADVRKRREDFQRRQRGIPTGVESYNGVDIGSARFDKPAESGGIGMEANSGNGADAGVRVEPAAHVTSEPAVSVPVGKKVQGVSPAQASAGHSRKAR